MGVDDNLGNDTVIFGVNGINDNLSVNECHFMIIIDCGIGV